ncbi:MULTISPECIES: hypothetical protein [unclassified Bradyrhizobium]|uniref:hypothetical protein n=1 Tax=Bradyrhizobium TaxID=374 RepID=UPI0028E63FF9|nr:MULTISPECIES: hypothetical protein [unclassified Bradyrhizobium]
MIVEIKAMCEANGTVLATTSYDDTNERARAVAVIALLEQVLAHSETAGDQRLFTLDVSPVSPTAAASSAS